MTIDKAIYIGCLEMLYLGVDAHKTEHYWSQAQCEIMSQSNVTDFEHTYM